MSIHSSKGKEWERTRKIVLDRAGRVCVYGCGREATHVDHIIAKANGGTDDMANLQALCATCNTTKGARLESKQRSVWYHPYWYPSR